MTNNKPLQSIINEAKQFIYRREGKFAASVINDFEDALRSGDNRHKTAYEWLQKYRKPGQPVKRAETKPRTVTAPKVEAPKYPKREPEAWTAYKPSGNKFAQMWEYSNILTKPYYRDATPRQVQKLMKRKLDTLTRMAAFVDSQTYEHFRMALTEVLRIEPEQDVRREAIYMLARHFSWSEIDTTFWLHGTRRPEDQYALIVAEERCKSRTQKNTDKVASDEVRLLLAETIR
jgi:hypothetical protein